MSTPEPSPTHRLRHILERATTYLRELEAASVAAMPSDLAKQDAETFRKIISICELGALASSDASRLNCLNGIEQISVAWQQSGFSPEFVKLHAIENLGAIVGPSTALN